MIKKLQNEFCCFDCEWVPDIESGRKVYQLPDVSDENVLDYMWTRAGKTEDNPQPFVKVVLSRLVSVAVVIRNRKKDTIKLYSLPDEEGQSEASIIERFLKGVGKHKPQLIGYNSANSDIRILVQRGLVNNIQAADFCHRPAKPWDGADYFTRYDGQHVDMMRLIGGWGKTTPSLHEIATLCGIPGKIGTSGDMVLDLYQQGHVDEIVQYNEFDALTTHLLWLRVCYFSGHLSSPEYDYEISKVHELIDKEKGDKPHLTKYQTIWRSMN